MTEKTLIEVLATFVPLSGERVTKWWPSSWDEDNKFVLTVSLGFIDETSEDIIAFDFIYGETSPHPSRGYEYRILNRLLEEEDGTRGVIYHAAQPAETQEKLQGTNADSI